MAGKLGYVTIVGAAPIAGCSSENIRRAIKCGELATKPTDCGRSKLLRTADVRAWGRQTRKPGRKPRSE